MQCLAASHIHRGVKNSISQLVLRALHRDTGEKELPKERRRLPAHTAVFYGPGDTEQVDLLLGTLIRRVTPRGIYSDNIRFHNVLFISELRSPVPPPGSAPGSSVPLVLLVRKQ